MFKPILDSDQGQALLRRAKAAGAAKRSKSSTPVAKVKPIKDTLNYKGTTPTRKVETSKKTTDDVKIKPTGGGGAAAKVKKTTKNKTKFTAPTGRTGAGGSNL